MIIVFHSVSPAESIISILFFYLFSSSFSVFPRLYRISQRTNMPRFISQTGTAKNKDFLYAVAEKEVFLNCWYYFLIQLWLMGVRWQLLQVWNLQSLWWHAVLCHASCPWELVQVPVPRLLYILGKLFWYLTTPSIHGNLSRYPAVCPLELLQVPLLLSIGSCPHILSIETLSMYHTSCTWDLDQVPYHVFWPGEMSRYPAGCPRKLVHYGCRLSVGTCL